MKKKYNFHERKKYYLFTGLFGFIVAPLATSSSVEGPIPIDTPGLLQAIIGNAIFFTIFSAMVCGNASYYVIAEKYSFNAAGFRGLKWLLLGFVWLFIASLLGIFTIVEYQP